MSIFFFLTSIHRQSPLSLKTGSRQLAPEPPWVLVKIYSYSAKLRPIGSEEIRLYQNPRNSHFYPIPQLILSYTNFVNHNLDFRDKLN